MKYIVDADKFDSMQWVSEWGARVIKLVSRGRYHELTRAIQARRLHQRG